MSGDVQPRKRKDKKRKKDDFGVVETRGTSAIFGEGDIFMHSPNDHGTGGHWCAKIIFFSLLAVLVTLVGLIILENRGLTELEANSVESRYSGVLEGWLEDIPDNDHHNLRHQDHIAKKYSDLEDKDAQLTEETDQDENDDDGNSNDNDNTIESEENQENQDQSNSDIEESNENLLYDNDDQNEELSHEQNIENDEGETDRNDEDESGHEFSEEAGDDYIHHIKEDISDEDINDNENIQELSDEFEDNVDIPEDYSNHNDNSQEFNDEFEDNVGISEKEVNGNNNGNIDEFSNEFKDDVHTPKKYISDEDDISKEIRREQMFSEEVMNENGELEEDKLADEIEERIQTEQSDEEPISMELPSLPEADDDLIQEVSKAVLNDDVDDQEDEDALGSDDEDYELPLVEHITAPAGQPLPEIDDDSTEVPGPDTLAEEEEYEKKQEEIRREEEEASHKDGGNDINEWPEEPNDPYWHKQLDQAEEELHQDWLN